MDDQAIGNQSERREEDEPGRYVRAGFVTEHMEIASHELLDLMARKAGDDRPGGAGR